MKQTPAIETTSLAIGYSNARGKKNCLNSNLNLQLKHGEVTSLLGSNGAGKSTLLRTLAGFQPELGGNIAIEGRDRSAIPQKELSRLIGVVLTERSMAGTLRVRELVSLGRHPYTGFFGMLKSRDHEIVDHAMQQVGIAHKADSYIAEISDGERQKAMIAKVLAQECPIILLDEPTAFLDITSRIELMILLRELAANGNKSILLSTHDIELALTLSDRLWMLKKHEGIVCGAPEDLVLDNSVGAYFGKENISFDTHTGRLAYKTNGEKHAYIESSGDKAYWLANAVKKLGYSLSDTPDGSTLTVKWDTPDSPITLRLPNGKEATAASIGEMVEMVKASLYLKSLIEIC